MLTRRRQMARLEALGAPYFERILQKWEENPQNLLAPRTPSKALIHAFNFSLVLLYGKPNINEPLLKAWERCVQSSAPQLSCERFQKITEHRNPFDNDFFAGDVAEYFRENILTTIRGGSELEKLEAIFASAPHWYIWFTWAPLTAKALNLKLPDISGFHPFELCSESYFRWPLLPEGAFECVPWDYSSLRVFPLAVRRTLFSGSLNPRNFVLID